MDPSKFLKNIIKYCIPSLASAIIGIAVIPVISRVFPPEDYGKINLFYSVGNMILYVVLLGLDSAYIRFYFEPPDGTSREQLFSLSIWSSVTILIALTLVATVGLPTIVSGYLFGERNIGGIIALSLYIVGLILFRILSIETRMEEKALRYNIQQILLIFTNRVSFVLVALYSTRYIYSIWAITLSSIILGLYFFITQKRLGDLSFPRVKKTVLKFVFLFAIPLMPTTVMTWLNNSAAKMVLSGFDDFNSVGILSIATSVANIFSLVPAAFATYWSPFMYKNYKEQSSFIKSVHDYICLLSIFLVVGIFCFQDILYFIVGGDYKVSQAYFMLVMLTPIQTLFCETTSYGIILSGNTKYNLFISLIAALFNISFGWCFYRYLGVYSVIGGIVGAALIQIVLKTVIGQKYYRTISSKEKTIFSVIVLFSLAVANVFLYPHFLLRLLIGFAFLIGSFFIYRLEVSSAVEYCRKKFIK